MATDNRRLGARADMIHVAKKLNPVVQPDGQFTTPDTSLILQNLKTAISAISSPLDCKDNNMASFLDANCEMETKYTSAFNPKAQDILDDKATYGCTSMSDAREEQRRQIDDRDLVQGSKEGLTDTLERLFGDIVTMNITNEDGQNLSTDDYTIKDIVDKIKDHAIPPESNECLQQLLKLLGFTINWSIPLVSNMNQLAVKCQTLQTSYGVNLTANIVLVIIRPQIEAASKLVWGNCLAPGVQKLNKDYPIGKVITDKQFDAAIAMLDPFDKLRNLKEATDVNVPIQPTMGQAHAVGHEVFSNLLNSGFMTRSAFEAQDAYDTDTEDEDNGEDFEVVSQVSGLTKASVTSKQVDGVRALLKKRQDAKKAAAAKKKAGAASASTGNGCPHCAFAGLTKINEKTGTTHPPGITVATCRANPLNFEDNGPAGKASADWVIKKWLEASDAVKQKMSGKD